MKARYNVEYASGPPSWKPYQVSHASEDANTTLCGKPVSVRYIITHNDYDGVTTCEKCRRIEAKEAA